MSFYPFRLSSPGSIPLSRLRCRHPHHGSRSGRHWTRTGTSRVLIITALVGVVLVGIALKAVITARQAQQAVRPQAMPPRAVKTTVLQAGTLRRTIPAMARLESDSSLLLSAEMAGILTDLPVREGDGVTAGQVLARINPAETQTQLTGARGQVRSLVQQVDSARAGLDALLHQQKGIQATLAIREKNLQRYRYLLDHRAIATSAYDIAWQQREEAAAAAKSLQSQIESARSRQNGLVAQLQSAQATVRLWNIRQGYGEIRSPIDGIVAQRLQEPGNRVGPGAPVIKLEAPRSARLLVKVPSLYLSLITVGEEVLFEDRHHGASAPNFRISRIHPTLDQWQLGTVEAVGTPAGIQAYGQEVPVRIVLREASGTIVPPAVYRKTGNQEIELFVIDGETARRSVATIEFFDDREQALVSPTHLPAGTRAVDTRFLESIRRPQEFPVRFQP